MVRWASKFSSGLLLLLELLGGRGRHLGPDGFGVASGHYR